jgi:hypothetical protein
MISMPFNDSNPTEYWRRDGVRANGNNPPAGIGLRLMLNQTSEAEVRNNLKGD